MHLHQEPKPFSPYLFVRTMGIQPLSDVVFVNHRKFAYKPAFRHLAQPFRQGCRGNRQNLCQFIKRVQGCRIRTKQIREAIFCEQTFHLPKSDAVWDIHFRPKEFSLPADDSTSMLSSRSLRTSFCRTCIQALSPIANPGTVSSVRSRSYQKVSGLRAWTGIRPDMKRNTPLFFHATLCSHRPLPCHPSFQHPFPVAPVARYRLVSGLA